MIVDLCIFGWQNYFLLLETYPHLNVNGRQNFGVVGLMMTD